VGEEGDAEPGTTGVRWIVDPIDGTVNFLYGLPQYAVSVAAEVDGEVVAGVVIDVAKSIEYVARPAADGTAALRNGRPIEVRGPAPLSQRLIATGFSYRSEVRAVQAEAVGRLLPQIRDIRRLGSCALDLCAVAEGMLDGYVEEGVNIWDHAAAGLIARAAGARTLELVGASEMPLLVCGPDHGFDELVRTVRSAGFTRE
jgi:myo-inositol-1(or 4)-monophosphatase